MVMMKVMIDLMAKIYVLVVVLVLLLLVLILVQVLILVHSLVQVVVHPTVTKVMAVRDTAQVTVAQATALVSTQVSVIKVMMIFTPQVSNNLDC